MPIMRANPARRRKRRTTKKKRTTRARKAPAKRTVRRKTSSTKRKAAAKKAAATRRRNANKRSAAAKKAARTRKRNARKTTRKANPARRKRRTSTTRRAAPKRRRRYARKATPKRRRRYTRKAAPKRRYNRRRRANPATGKKMFGKVLALTGGFFANSALTGIIAPRVPFLATLPMGLGRPALSAALTAAVFYGKKKIGVIRKIKLISNDVIAGMAVNTVKELVTAVAPASIKSMIGLGAADIYGPSLGEYVQLNDYVQIGDAPPIDDDIALADYVSIGQIEQDLGQIEQDLGMTQDLGMVEQSLGDWATVVPGGVPRTGPGSMQAPITKHKQIRGAVPARSFQAPITDFGPGFDYANALYSGSFAGGFGN